MCVLRGAELTILNDHAVGPVRAIVGWPLHRGRHLQGGSGGNKGNRRKKGGVSTPAPLPLFFLAGSLDGSQNTGQRGTGSVRIARQ